MDEGAAAGARGDGRPIGKDLIKAINKAHRIGPSKV